MRKNSRGATLGGYTRRSTLGGLALGRLHSGGYTLVATLRELHSGGYTRWGLYTRGEPRSRSYSGCDTWGLLHARGLQPGCGLHVGSWVRHSGAYTRGGLHLEGLHSGNYTRGPTLEKAIIVGGGYIRGPTIGVRHSETCTWGLQSGGLHSGAWGGCIRRDCTLEGGYMGGLQTRPTGRMAKLEGRHTQGATLLLHTGAKLWGLHMRGLRLGVPHSGA